MDEEQPFLGQANVPALVPPTQSHPGSVIYQQPTGPQQQPPASPQRRAFDPHPRLHRAKVSCCTSCMYKWLGTLTCCARPFIVVSYMSELTNDIEVGDYKMRFDGFAGEYCFCFPPTPAKMGGGTLFFGPLIYCMALTSPMLCS